MDFLRLWKNLEWLNRNITSFTTKSNKRNFWKKSESFMIGGCWLNRFCVLNFSVSTISIEFIIRLSNIIWIDHRNCILMKSIREKKNLFFCYFLDSELVSFNSRLRIKLINNDLWCTNKTILWFYLIKSTWNYDRLPWTLRRKCISYLIMTKRAYMVVSIDCESYCNILSRRFVMPDLLHFFRSHVSHDTCLICTKWFCLL